MYYKTKEDFLNDNGYDVNGTWYPRVTKIVGIKAKPALYRYYARAKSFEDAEKSTEKSAEEGTLIHELVQAHWSGETPEIPDTVAPAVRSA
jgi:hypothetical protein